jgi:3-hydroxyacyl-[acyl-carrier-protein] dehydratase
MEIPREQITQLIPHRYPFLFIDAVTDYEPGKSITGYKMVTHNEPFFQGHFPQKPVMPGVIIVEAMAQLGCVFMSMELGPEEARKRTPLFLGIDKAKFRSIVEPGMKLDMRIDVLKMRRGMAIVHAVAKVGDTVAVEAELTCMMK